ncbi:MAG: hypothetical protein Q8L15_09800 [Methylobacter sp.]|nr:hypothetical protein [Methylobacter sp.]
MNDEQKYHVVFTGRFAPDIDRAAVMQNLANLYKTDVQSIAQHFSSADTVLKNNLSQAAANQYVNALNTAGALCLAVAIPVSKPLNAQSPAFLEHQLGVGDIRCSPLPINRITQSQDGININRVDKKDIPFQDIMLLSVYENTESADCKILLFLKGFKQPFECDCYKITYSDFFDVKGSTMQDSIRRFANYLLSNNPHLLFDKNTYEFVQGGKLPEFNGDVVRLSTALSAALPQRDNDSPAINTAPEPPPNIAPQPEPATEAVEQPIVAETQNQPTLATCPKCGQSHAQGQLECSHCGVVFAKWHKKKKQEEQAILQAKQNKDAPVEFDYDWELDELDLWTQQKIKSFTYLLIAGFVLPLFKHSMLFGSSELVWPWNIMGLGIDEQKAAAMATASLPEHMLAWGLLPLGVSIALLSGRLFMPLRSLTATLFLAGATALTLMLTVFYEEAEILGLMFTPPTAGAGIMILLAVVAGALVAGSNHLRKRFSAALPIRVLSGVGGGMMVALMGLQLLASSGGWATWSMMLLYLLMISYGVLGLLSAFRPEPEDALLQRTSFVARVVLWWAPVACLIAQNWLTDPYTDLVTGGGGGFINIFVSLAKCFSLYYGFSFLMALGFTAYLEQSMLKRQALDNAP